MASDLPTGAVSPVTTGQTYSVHDLAHAKGVPTAAREAMLIMQERITQQEAVIAGLVEACEAAINFFRTAPLESGYCCCGDAVESHGMWSGHSPVDELAYHASGVQDQLSATLAKAKESRDD